MILGNSLIWTGKGINTTTKRFTAHGEVKLEQGVELETSEEQPLAFRVGNLILSCTTQDERDKWLTDIANLVQNHEPNEISLLKRNDITDEDEDTDPSLASQTPSVNEANSVLTVCWHRNASISRDEYRLALSNELSGVLLRRFKKQEMG